MSPNQHAIIDTHCHLDVEEFDPDRPAVVANCRSQQIIGIVVPGIHRDGWQRTLDCCRQFRGLYPALGLHPVYLAQHRDEHLAELETRIATEHPVAIGEIGLDYFLTDFDRARQQEIFDAQLAIARAVGLPVLLHVRKAHDQVIASLKRARVSGGIAHAFNGSLPQAHQYIALGFKLGFGGMLTYERSRRIRALARDLPLTSIVLETDAPDLTVANHRGERNSPEYLPDCLAALAEVRDEDPAIVAAQTTMNAREVLGKL
jgi:TatD DNase family protein